MKTYNKKRRARLTKKRKERGGGLFDTNKQRGVFQILNPLENAWTTNPKTNMEITRKIDALLDYYNVPYGRQAWESESSLNPFAGNATRYMPSVSNKLSALIIFLKIPYIFTDGTKSWDCSLYDAYGKPVPNGYCTRGRGVCKNEDQRRAERQGTRYFQAYIRFWNQAGNLFQTLPSITGKLNAILVHLANHPPPGKPALSFTFNDKTEAKNCSLDGAEIGNWRTNKGRGDCRGQNGQPILIRPEEVIPESPTGIDTDAEQELVKSSTLDAPPAPVDATFDDGCGLGKEGSGSLRKYNPNTPVVIKHKLNAILVWLQVPYLFDNNLKSTDCKFFDATGTPVAGYSKNEGKGYCEGKVNLYGNTLASKGRDPFKRGDYATVPPDFVPPQVPKRLTEDQKNEILYPQGVGQQSVGQQSVGQQQQSVGPQIGPQSNVGGRRSRRRKITRRRKYNRS